MRHEVIEDVWLDWQDEVYACPEQNVAVSGGLGCGKTALIPKIILREATRYPGSKGALGMPDLRQLDDSIHHDVIVPYFNRMKVRAHFVKSELRWYFSNGSTLKYISFHGSMESLKGPQYDYGLLDEADNPKIDREKYEAFEGRIGREEASIGSGKVWVFLNPVSHGHHVYQYFRELDDLNYRLFEISTYQNRRFLTESYIRKRDARHPPGTPGHDRWTLGKCGIPSERAVFKYFKYARDRITVEEVADAGGLTNFRSGLQLIDGQPTGWLQVGFTKDGVMVPVREVVFPGDGPDVIAKQLKIIRAPGSIKMTDIAPVLPKDVRLSEIRETGGVLADRAHKAFQMVSASGLPLTPARGDISTGINRGRNLIQRGKLKLLKRPDGRCATPRLLTELEEHQFSESGELEKEKWSLVRPFEFLAVATHRGGELTGTAGKKLRQELVDGGGKTPGFFRSTVARKLGGW